MTTFDYGRMREVVLRLLVKFGKVVALDRPGDSYDPGTGEVTGVPLVLNGQGVLLDFNKSDTPAFPSVKATDRKLLYLGDPIDVGDKYNGWRVHAKRDIDPDESGNILTIAQMRK